ncbi:U32 family peptidase [Pseudovibrio sp. Tun.PSC04-5.I4]|uniref:ubiquinone anaerobic biosynthesis protein UbiV n=1 Tax=Pseudovibrio sp. Tun.PSC04-5.I4 TaxID=1798213 RepID=UPI000890562C|nr:U32 family peptidase [Pseudovibrio sp. Tun.PSC04-5.I4]SDR21947.1 Collagenase-like protease, PrtC family [Pseudovibrio sp. Tun.PSC04-5.I4]
MSKIELSIGPNFFNWPNDKLVDFYARIADEAPVERVYIGEVICGKRMPFNDKVWPDIYERLIDAGKTVVFSTMALPVTVRDRKSIAALSEDADLVEANDIAGVHRRSGQPFVGGPFLNIYNEETAKILVNLGMETFCPPVELQLKFVETIAKALPDLTIELFAFGRLPLAVSGRCYHARAHKLHKDNCQFICDRDPDGMDVTTLDDQKFLSANGIQTLSHSVQAVTLNRDELLSKGIGRLRLSPHDIDMIAIAEIFRDLADGKIDGSEAEARLQAQSLPGALANGYLTGKPGHLWQAD